MYNPSSRTKRRKVLKNVDKGMYEIQSLGLLGLAPNGNISCNLFRESNDNFNQQFENVINDNKSISEGSDSDSDNLQNGFKGQSDSDSSSDSECELDYISDSQFVSNLGKWAVDNNITTVALQSLLYLLNSKFENLNLPKDPRTLLHTPRAIVINEVGSGKYHHFGVGYQIRLKVEKGLRCMQINNSNTNENLLTLKVGIDGLPISKSNNRQFWPILGILEQAIDKRPFIIGLYLGLSKPNSVKEYLQPFIEEMKHIQQNGIEIDSKVYTVRVSSVIANAPARAFIKCVKNHNSYSGCERCTQVGEWCGRVVYPLLECPKREDGDFDNPNLESDGISFCEHKEYHHTNITPLKELQIGLVSQFPIDYMHLVCLGVTRKLLNIWLRGSLPNRLSSLNIDSLSTRLIQYASFIPKEFARKSRSIRELDHWKATEFRLFLLYLGPIALQNILPLATYNHFMLLRHSMFVLLSPDTDSEWLSFARKSLKMFIEMAKEIYGNEFIVYNVHNLEHLADDYEIFGKLDECSAFDFENYMQRLKKMLRSKSMQIQQVVKRCAEVDNFRNIGLNTLKKPKNALVSNNIYISSKVRDRCFITNKKDVIIIKKVIGNQLRCQKFNKIESYYNYPCESSLLYIIRVSDLSNEIVINLSELYRKCILVPIESDIYACVAMANGHVN